jgi:multicomponent Na+:H+ antiporter subunit G
MTAVTVISYIFIVIGLFFNVIGVFGLYRFPDVYTRLHAATKCTTFGTIFLVLAVIARSAGAWVIDGEYSSQSGLTVHSAIALVLLLVTNSTAAHAISRAAYRSGEKPVQAVIDDLEGKNTDAE